MKREILFRGKRLDNGEWAEGGAVVDSDSAHIVYQINEHIKRDDYECYAVEVDSATISQFTGLVDKNGKKIFENDVVDSGGHFYMIKHEIGAFMLVRMSDKTDMYTEFMDAWNDDVYPIAQMYWNESGEENVTTLKIIGNAWDNPELVANHD